MNARWMASFVRVRKRPTLTALLLLLLVSMIPMPRTVRAADPALAVIIHPSNEVSDLSEKDLRDILRLDRQFWPNGRRVVLLLRPTGSPEKEMLLEKIYQVSDEVLRKVWVNRLFAGQIPAVPAVVKTGASAASAVRQSQGAVSIILASEVPTGVKVLSIDGKKPGDPGYLLSSAGGA